MVLQVNPLPVSSTPAATSSTPVATSSAPVTTLAATTGPLASTPLSTTFTLPFTTRTPVATTAAPVTTTVLSSTIALPTTSPTSVPVLKVTADPPAAEFPGCGKRTNLTATVPSATVSGSITFDLTNPRLEGLPIEQYATRQLGVATLFGGTATLMASLFPAFPPGDHGIRATYAGPSSLNGGSAQVTYAVSTLCL